MSMKVIDDLSEFLQKYPNIELFGKEVSYSFYQYLQQQQQAPLYARLISIGIPACSVLSLITKALSDLCRIIDTLLQSVSQRQYVGGNVLSLMVDVFEYGRSFLGCLLGWPFALLTAPGKAAQKFLTIETQQDNTFLTPTEGAYLYAMADSLHAFFKKHQLDYRICSGTALGAKREKGIIRNDDDIDLMLHPDSVEAFAKLVESGVFQKETGIEIESQKMTGGWQCFYSDSKKGEAGTPTEKIGNPFVDIFPGCWRKVNRQQVITFGEDKMYYLSKGDYFTQQEWVDKKLYPFGPTAMWGINNIRNYLQRSYGPFALQYITRLYPHDVYSTLYGHPLTGLQMLSKSPTPRLMRHKGAEPLPFDSDAYQAKTHLAEKRIYVDGVFDLFHKGHRKIIKNAIEMTRQKYDCARIVIYIGICDDGVAAYKRKTIMTLDERNHAIQMFMDRLKDKTLDIQFVLVPNCPISLTQAYVTQNKIDVVFHGDDFSEEKIDKYYGDIKQLCQFEMLPYTKGVSTTQLIIGLKQQGFFAAKNKTGVSTDELVTRVKRRSIAEWGIESALNHEITSSIPRGLSQAH